MANILNIISAVTPSGGTITKLRALMTKSKKHKHFLYHPGFKANESDIRREIGWYREAGIPAFYGINGRNVFKNAVAVAKIIKENDIDIVHFYFNHEQTFAGLVQMLCPKVKMVRSIVGFDQRLSLFRRLSLNVALSFIDNYIYISEYIKALYENEYPKLKHKNTQIIFNGPVNVSNDVAPLEDREWLVSTGGLCERKNQKVLLEAMNILVNDRNLSNIKLKLLGEGPLHEEYAKMIKLFRLENNVVLTGLTKDVSSHLNDCAIYVHPATTEGFGIAVTEAMFMGCPCIVADKGALPELVDNSCGVIVSHDDAMEWADAIQMLMSDKSKRVKMGNAARERAINKFSLDAFVNNHEEYYSKLLKSR